MVVMCSDLGSMVGGYQFDLLHASKQSFRLLEHIRRQTIRTLSE
jgi:hypothetical protein